MGMKNPFQLTTVSKLSDHLESFVSELINSFHGCWCGFLTVSHCNIIGSNSCICVMEERYK